MIDANKYFILHAPAPDRQASLMINLMHFINGQGQYPTFAERDGAEVLPPDQRLERGIRSGVWCIYFFVYQKQAPGSGTLGNSGIRHLCLSKWFENWATATSIISTRLSQRNLATDPPVFAKGEWQNNRAAGVCRSPQYI
ncbi:MAG: hypothetical protein K9J77_12745 [Rhodoferax sp.]|nr:hypothetical protein [Rhodoferax sp.]